MRKYCKFVYAVSKNLYKVIDTAKDEASMKKRLEKKKYDDDVVFVQVDILSPLVSLRTDEQIGADILTYGLTAAAATGTDAQVALDNMEKTGFIVYCCK